MSVWREIVYMSSLSLSHNTRTHTHTHTNSHQTHTHKLSYTQLQTHTHTHNLLYTHTHNLLYTHTHTQTLHQAHTHTHAHTLVQMKCGVYLVNVYKHNTSCISWQLPEKLPHPQWNHMNREDHCEVIYRHTYIHTYILMWLLIPHVIQFEHTSHCSISPSLFFP